MFDLTKSLENQFKQADDLFFKRFIGRHSVLLSESRRIGTSKLVIAFSVRPLPASEIGGVERTSPTGPGVQDVGGNFQD